MSEQGTVTVSGLNSIGTLEQIELFKNLSAEKKNMETLLLLDEYARPRAFKYLPDGLRIWENFNKLPDFDRWLAFKFLNEECKTMEYLKYLDDEQQWQAFQFLSEYLRTMKNLKQLPREYWHLAFQFLCEEEKMIGNWKQLPRKNREKAFEFLSASEKICIKIKNCVLKRTVSAIGAIAGIILSLVGITLIILHFFCPPAAIFIDALIGLSTAACAGIFVAADGLLFFFGITATVFGIKKYMQANKMQKSLQKKIDGENSKSVLVQNQTFDIHLDLEHAITESEEQNKNLVHEANEPEIE